MQLSITFFRLSERLMRLSCIQPVHPTITKQYLKPELQKSSYIYCVRTGNVKNINTFPASIAQVTYPLIKGYNIQFTVIHME